MATERTPARGKGFTLIEAIVAITLLGILGGTVAVFIRSPLQSYFDSANRAVLTDAADGALRRISRDVAAALPNSLRSTGGGSTSCFEFIPVVAGGRYRYQYGSSGNGTPLDFTTTATSFDVLGQVRLGNLPAGTNLVAIYNLGIARADAYNGDTTATISSATTSSITLNPGTQFPFTSPGKMFQVIPNYSVVYSCSGNTLYRSINQPFSATKMASCPTTGTPLVSNVSGCNFYYLPVNTRDGMLSMSLALTLNNETVTLYDQVMVNNAP